MDTVNNRKEGRGGGEQRNDLQVHSFTDYQIRLNATKGEKKKVTIRNLFFRKSLTSGSVVA